MNNAYIGRRGAARDVLTHRAHYIFPPASPIWRLRPVAEFGIRTPSDVFSDDGSLALDAE